MGLFNSMPRRAPGTYRVRKEGGIFSTLLGALFGIVCVVFLSPVAAWYAESQHRAADFATASVVDASGTASGYVVVEGMVTNVDPLTCPVDDSIDDVTEDEVVEPTNCLYVATDNQTYTRTEKEVCGSPSQNQTILYQTTTECDADGTNCEPCYQVEEYNWASAGEKVVEVSDITLGNYSITPSEKGNYIGSKEMTVYDFKSSATDPLEGDKRRVYEYMASDQDLLIAGDSEDNVITTAYEGKPYVFSTLSYQGTLEELESQDNTTKWGLRILSLVLMVLGVVFIFGPLTLFTNVLKVIPGLGKHLDTGFDGVIKFVAALIGLVLWLVVWGVVLVVKNIWIVVIILAVIGVGVLVLVQKGKKKKGSGGGASTPPTAPEQ